MYILIYMYINVHMMKIINRYVILLLDYQILFFKNFFKNYYINVIFIFRTKILINNSLI